jgi:hypothetical protein
MNIQASLAINRCAVCDLPAYYDRSSTACYYHWWLSREIDPCLICFVRPKRGTAYRAKCCDKQFCQTCWDKWIEKKQECAHCRASYLEKEANKEIKDKV